MVASETLGGKPGHLGAAPTSLSLSKLEPAVLFWITGAFPKILVYFLSL